MSLEALIRLSNARGACTDWIKADMMLIGTGLIKVEAVTRWSSLKKKPTHSEVRFAGQVLRQRLDKNTIDVLWPPDPIGSMTLSLPMSLKIEADASLKLPAWATM